MSRSGYIDDWECGQWDLIRWRGAVKSAARGARGQQFFRDLIAALDAMEVKEIADHTLAAPTGPVCAMGAVARHRGVDLQKTLDEDWDDPEETSRAAARRLNIAETLALETAFINDEANYHEETPAERWVRVRKWASSMIVADNHGHG